MATPRQRGWPVTVMQSDISLPVEKGPKKMRGQHVCRIDGPTDLRQGYPLRVDRESHSRVYRIRDFPRRSLGKHQQLLGEARASARASCGSRAAIGANKTEHVFEKIFRCNSLSSSQSPAGQRRCLPGATKFQEVEVSHQDIHPMAAGRLAEPGQGKTPPARRLDEVGVRHGHRIQRCTLGRGESSARRGT